MKTQELVDLHAPVRDDDRRRSAARAVPRHPGASSRRTRPSARSSARVKSDVEQGSTFADALGKHPQRLRRALREPGHGRRGRRHPRHDPEPPRGLPREGRQRSSARSRARWSTRVTVIVVAIGVLVLLLIKVIPVFEKMFNGLRRRAARADPDRDRPQPTGCSTSIVFILVGIAAIAVVVRPGAPAGSPRFRYQTDALLPEAADLRGAAPQGRGRALHPHLLDDALVGRADPRRARHLRARPPATA